MYRGSVRFGTVRLGAAAVATVVGLFVSACASDSPRMDTEVDHSAQEIAGDPAGYNADDIAFVDNMIPHLGQAIELAALVPDRTADPGVIGLAASITSAATSEVATMKVFSVQWHEDPDSDTGQAGQGNGSPGLVDAATVAQLQSLKDGEFDRLWLHTMIRHHEGAVSMADAEIANGHNVDAVNLAKQIAERQRAQIGQMRQVSGGG